MEKTNPPITLKIKKTGTFNESLSKLILHLFTNVAFRSALANVN
jgi:hypothetical protein